MNDAKRYLTLIYGCLIPGSGHLLIGENKRACLIFVGCVICMVIPYLGWIIGLLIYGWSIADIARKSFSEKKERVKAISNAFLVIVAVAILVVGVMSYGIIHLLRASKEKAGGKYVKNQMVEIVSETINFEKINKKLPETLDELIGVSPLMKKYKSDYWGNKYQYTIVNREISIISPGKDKTIDTEDDIVIRKRI